MKFLKQISLNEWLSTLIISSAAFLLLGAMTALWSNPFFMRMTEVSRWDYILLSFESLLIGLFFGIQAAHCATKKAGIGGVLGFFGFSCSICNKILLLLFGSSFLLSYFEPARHYRRRIGFTFVFICPYPEMVVAASCFRLNCLQKETVPDSEVVL